MADTTKHERRHVQDDRKVTPKHEYIKCEASPLTEDLPECRTSSRSDEARQVSLHAAYVSGANTPEPRSGNCGTRQNGPLVTRFPR